MSEQVLTEQQVADYLAETPDFFTRHQKLLEKLYVPHNSGSAVSLVERQTTVLREKNQQLYTHLSDLIEIARHNDTQFEKTKRMVLAMLESATLDDVAVATDESLCRDFHSDHTQLLLFSDKPLNVNNLRMMGRGECGLIESLVATNLPTCGQLPEAQHRFLFLDEAVRIQSAAVVPLVKGETLGLLAIGSYDPNYFQSSQGTLFLSYVGEVLSRVISGIWRDELISHS